MKIKALLGFYHEGKLVKAGSVVDVHEGLMRELVNSHKAEIVEEAHAKAAVKSDEKKEK